MYDSRIGITDTMMLSNDAYQTLQQTVGRSFLSEYPRSDALSLVFPAASAAAWDISPVILAALQSGALPLLTATVEMTLFQDNEPLNRAVVETTLTPALRNQLLASINTNGVVTSFDALLPQFFTATALAMQSGEQLPQELQTFAALDVSFQSLAANPYTIAAQTNPHLASTCLLAAHSILDLRNRGMNRRLQAFRSSFYLHKSRMVSWSSWQVCVGWQPCLLAIIMVVAGFGIVGLYVSFVLVVANIIR
jgi:hypothetical protein